MTILILTQANKEGKRCIACASHYTSISQFFIPFYVQKYIVSIEGKLISFSRFVFNATGMKNSRSAEARLKTRKDLIPGLMLIERLYNNGCRFRMLPAQNINEFEAARDR